MFQASFERFFKMEYYSSLENKEILQYVTTWMNLEDIMLSEILQSQKDHYCRSFSYEVSKTVKFIESESGRVDARGWGRRKWGVTNQSG